MPDTKPALPVWGEILWLTAEQGGRDSGPPATPWDTYYYATAFVPPDTSRVGLSSIIVDVAVRDSWSSHAKAGWLAEPGPAVDEGSVIMVTEGPAVVALFTVTHVEQPSDRPAAPPLTGQDVAAIEARAAAATQGPWRSFVEGRDHLAGDSFIMTGPESDRGPDLYLSWDPPAPEARRAADQDFIAQARQDIPDLVAEVRELREWHELSDVDPGATPLSDCAEDSAPRDLVYVVETDPDDGARLQVGAFTSRREAFKPLRDVRGDRPSEPWVINTASLWETFGDYRRNR